MNTTDFTCLRLLHPVEGSLDHVVPRSRGGADSWENLVWSAKEVNPRKADRLPYEAGLRLLNEPLGQATRLATDFVAKFILGGGR